MATFTAFYDANVLYPAELRNLLMHLALTGLFRARWSPDVHEEWIAALLADRHILAAAIRGQANVIVTMNLRDFPAGALAPFGMEAQYPDEFILHLLDLAPGSVLPAAESHRQSLKNPARTMDEYLETLERQGLAQSASALRQVQLGYPLQFPPSS